MISQLRGEVVHVAGRILTLDVQGVGYEIHATAECASHYPQGSEAKIVIHTDVKEDLIRLYGFSDHLEKQVFLLLTLVKGVGAKSASEILSQIDKKELLRTIGSGDIAGLQRLKGVGKKTAERIIVELKDKVGEYVMESHVSRLSVEKEVVTPFVEATEALVALGFTRKDAERAVGKVESERLPQSDAGSIVREALRFV